MGKVVCVAGLLLMLGSGPIPAEVEPGASAEETAGEPSTAIYPPRLREDLRPFDFETIGTPSKAEAAYFDFYGLDVAQHQHHFGRFRSGSHELAAHAFLPEAPRATVILMHGYLDHVGILSSTIRHLLDRDYAVAAYDQPGHGLSSGARASIGDFREYARIFEDFLRLCRAHMPSPLHVAAHSTGGGIVVDHLLSRDDDDLEQVVLVAPLVRSAHWQLSKSFSPMVDAFVDEVPRVFRKNTSDEQFLEFVRQDPLQPRRTSLAWFKALVEWNERIERYPPRDRPVLIIQGNADSVVDWEYNLDFLKTKFPNARVEIVDLGRHQLLNEGPALRARVLSLVDQALAGGSNP